MSEAPSSEARTSEAREEVLLLLLLLLLPLLLLLFTLLWIHIDIFGVRKRGYLAWSRALILLGLLCS